MNIGFGVLGYNRPTILLNTLTSLLSQNPTNVVVFLDKPSNPKHIEGHRRCWQVVEALKATNHCYTDLEVRLYNAPQGVEAAVCNSVQYMINNFDAFVFLEDDQFPTQLAVKTFESDLRKIASIDNVYSVYGHHFNIPQEKKGEPTIQRFQGWGWGAWSERIDPIFQEVQKYVFGSKDEYLEGVIGKLTPEVNKRLAVTRTRAVAHTLRAGIQAWDETTAVLTAHLNMFHMPTSRRVIYNCGEDGVHFPKIIRDGDFNMIAAQEVWDYYEQ